jgi:tetratricopeptide (TPR) repeat protein
MRGRLSSFSLHSVILSIIFSSMVVGCATTAGIENNKVGLSHLGHARYTEAENEFSAANKANPSNPVFLNNIGVACFMQWRLDDAAKYYNEAIKIDDNNALFYRNLGNVYHVQGKLEDAMQQYKKALSINSVEPNTHFKMIDVAYDLGDTGKYVSDFEELIKNAKPEGSKGINTVFLPEQAILHAYELQGKHDEVIARATKDIDVIKGVDKEEGGYVIPIITPFFFYIKTVPKTQINVGPVVGSLYAFRGRAYLRKGNVDAAVADLKSSVENAPLGFGGINLGIAFLEAGDYREASYQLRKSVETSPSSNLARLYYSSALRLDGQRSEADKQFAQATTNKINIGLKSNHEYLEALAYAYYVSEHFDKSIGMYELVIQSYPYSGRSYRNLGAIYLKKQNKAKATENLSKAKNIMPEDKLTQKLIENLSKMNAL